MGPAFDYDDGPPKELQELVQSKKLKPLLRSRAAGIRLQSPYPSQVSRIIEDSTIRILERKNINDGECECLCEWQFECSVDIPEFDALVACFNPQQQRAIGAQFVFYINLRVPTSFLA